MTGNERARLVTVLRKASGYLNEAADIGDCRVRKIAAEAAEILKEEEEHYYAEMREQGEYPTDGVRRNEFTLK